MKPTLWLAGTGFVATLKTILGSAYEFVLGLGGVGLALLALADSSFISVPEGNDLLIVILSTGKSWSRMLFYVGMTTLGSVIGCLLLYSVGRKGGNFVRRRVDHRRLDRTGQLYERWGILSILVPSLLPPPCPFKIFVLSAGVFAVPTSKFIFAVAVGRAIRYLTWGVLAVLYGEAVRQFLLQNLHSVGLIVFGVFVLVIVSLLIRQRTRRRAIEEAA